MEEIQDLADNLEKAFTKEANGIESTFEEVIGELELYILTSFLFYAIGYDKIQAFSILSLNHLDSAALFNFTYTQLILCT